MNKKILIIIPGKLKFYKKENYNLIKNFFKDFAQSTGREVCEKLKDLIPRHNFMIPVQAAIGGKIIARETIKGFKKDVLTKIHGGGARDRKRKLLDKQKKGKTRSKQFGRVEIPQTAFIGVLKINKD